MEGDDALPADAVIIIAVQGPSGLAVLCLSECNHFPPVSEALRWEEAGVCLGCTLNVTKRGSHCSWTLSNLACVSPLGQVPHCAPGGHQLPGSEELLWAALGSVPCATPCLVFPCPCFLPRFSADQETPKQVPCILCSISIYWEPAMCCSFP